MNILINYIIGCIIFTALMVYLIYKYVKWNGKTDCVVYKGEYLGYRNYIVNNGQMLVSVCPHPKHDSGVIIHAYSRYEGVLSYLWGNEELKELQIINISEVNNILKYLDEFPICVTWHGLYYPVGVSGRTVYFAVN